MELCRVWPGESRGFRHTFDILKKKAFPDTPLLAVQQRDRAVLPAAESALISADAEQISLTEALRPKQRVCAVLVEQ